MTYPLSWTPTVKDIVTGIALVFGFGIAYAHIGNRLDDHDKAIGGVQVLTEKLSAKLDKVDQDGTRAAQGGHYAESETSKMNERRLSALESQWMTIGPQIAEIGTNIRWLMKDRGIEK